MCECATDVNANGIRSFLEKIFFVLKKMGDSNNDQENGVSYDYNGKKSSDKKEEELNNFPHNFVQWDVEKPKNKAPDSNWAKFDYRGSKEEDTNHGSKEEDTNHGKDSNWAKFDYRGSKEDEKDQLKGLTFGYPERRRERNEEENGLKFGYPERNADDKKPDKVKGLSFRYEDTNNQNSEKANDIFKLLLQRLFAKALDSKREKRETSAILFSTGIFGIKVDKYKQLKGVSYDYKDIGKTSLSKKSSSDEEESHKMKNLQGVSYDYKNIGKTSLSKSNNEIKNLQGVSYDYPSIGKTSLSKSNKEMKKLQGVSYDYPGTGKTSLSKDDQQTSVSEETSKWLPGTVDDEESWNFYKNMLIGSKQSEKAAKNLAVFMFCKLKKYF